MRAALPLLLVACGTEPDVVLDNVGELYVHPYADELDASELDETAPDRTTAPLTAGRVAVTVKHAMGCDHDFEASCVVVPEANGFVVLSHLAWNSERTTACSREQHWALAYCLSPALSEGTYSVTFGEAQGELVIPGDSGMLINTSVPLPR